MWTPSTRTRTVAALAVAAPLIGLASGCGEDPTGRGVTIEELEEPQYFHEGEYLGQTVTITAPVSAVLADDRIEVDGAHNGDDSLLVVTENPIDVAVGDLVRITGTVGQYHVTMKAEGVPPVPYDQYEKYETEPFLHDARVEPLPGS